MINFRKITILKYNSCHQSFEYVKIIGHFFENQEEGQAYLWSISSIII